MAGIRLNTAERNRLFGQAGHVPVQNVKHLLPWEIDQSVWVHRILVPLFTEACNEAARESSWVPRRADSYVVRPIRGSSEWSIHSWAMAWDFFATGPTTPPPGGVWHPYNTVPQAFAWPFQRRGFTWGATFNRVDYPHIEWASYPPDSAPPQPTPIPPNIGEELLSGLPLSEQREIRDRVRNIDAKTNEIHQVLFAGTSPREEVNPAIVQAIGALIKGVPKVGIAPILEAVNKTNYSVAGIGSDNLRTATREIVEDVVGDV